MAAAKGVSLAHRVRASATFMAFHPSTHRAASADRPFEQFAGGSRWGINRGSSTRRGGTGRLLTLDAAALEHDPGDHRGRGVEVARADAPGRERVLRHHVEIRIELRRGP